MADPVRAADLYRRAAQARPSVAALRYGLALNDGLGVRKNPAPAQQWLLYADKWGVPEAALAMGDMAARTPASRDKAANEKAVRTASPGTKPRRRPASPRRSSSWPMPISRAQACPRSATGAAMVPRAAARPTRGPTCARHLPHRRPRRPARCRRSYKWLLLADRAGMPDSKGVREKAAEKIAGRSQARRGAGERVRRPTRTAAR